MDERLERILIRVQAGQTLRDALYAEKLLHYYYSTPDDEAKREGKARIRAARKQLIALRRRLDPAKGSNLPSGTSFLNVTMPASRKQDFMTMCEERGVDMTKRINSLIVADLNAWRAGKVDEENGN